MNTRNTINNNYKCRICNCSEYKTETVAMTGGGLTKLVDVQNKKFTAIICKDCGYTEFFRSSSSLLFNILDFLT